MYFKLQIGKIAAISICNVESLTNNKHFDQLSLLFKIIQGVQGVQGQCFVLSLSLSANNLERSLSFSEANLL
jgi:hypothetical protein